MPRLVVSELILVRHGDRFDYSVGDKEWRKQASILRHAPNDPPLSALGRKQARDTGEEIWRLCQCSPGSPSSRSGDIGGGESSDLVSKLLTLVRTAAEDEFVGSLEENNDEDGASNTRVLVSPYMRVIQTAVPLADHFMTVVAAKKSKKPVEETIDASSPCNPGVLCIEPLLSEVRHVPGLLTTAEERWPYFPQINVDYNSLIDRVNGNTKGSEPFVFDLSDTHQHIPGTPACESYPKGYMERSGILAQKIDEDLLNPCLGGKRRLVCFSHAASVALVGHLLKVKDLRLVGKFAPCGVFRLIKISITDDEGKPLQVKACQAQTSTFPSIEAVLSNSSGKDSETVLKNSTSRWLLIKKGETNQPYVTENSPATYPWTFPEVHLNLWEKEIASNYDEYTQD